VLPDAESDRLPSVRRESTLGREMVSDI